MKQIKLKMAALAVIMAPLGTLPALAAVATFDDLSLSPNSHYGGAGSGAGNWVDGGFTFKHASEEYFWSGFVYSNINNTTTEGYLNQFAAYTGKDFSGSGNYAISYSASYLPITDPISFTDTTGGAPISGAYFTNTTYATLSMLNGDWVAKKFGGATGNDPDWFKLTIEGFNTDDASTGFVDFYLADFRFTDNSLDYIVDEWTWVDLSGLGNVASLQFSMSSSDTGDYGMNTPSYFAMDNLDGASPVPVPGAVWLLGSGLLSLLAHRRKND